MSDKTTTILPDGSAFFTMSFPLPDDHWLYAPSCQEWDSSRDTTADTPHAILPGSLRDHVRAAAKYAIRASTRNGKEMDFDPDAMMQNFVYALCGSSVAHEAMTPAMLEAVAGYYHDGPYRDSRITERLHADATTLSAQTARGG